MKKIISFIFILTFIFSCTGTAFADYIEIEEGSRGCVTAVLDSVGNVTEKVCDSLFGRPTRRRVVRTIPPYASELCTAPVPDGFVMTPYGYAVPVCENRKPKMVQNVVINSNSNNSLQETNAGVKEETQVEQPVKKDERPNVTNNYYTTKNYNTYKTYKTYKTPNGQYKTSK